MILFHPKIRCQNIVQVYDFGVKDGLYYMVLEYVTGGTLKDWLKQRIMESEEIPLPQVVQIINEVATALDYAHAQGIVHRDLKPANIMLTDKGQVVLADFGLARLMGSTQHTATGTIWGTPAYMSPEQAQGERGDARSDIYSLGVILYELLTGQVPFEADTPFGLMMKHINEPVPSPREIKVHLPDPIDPIIHKALAKTPKDRYSTAGELAKELAQMCRVDISI